jgi:hypothetical protein
VGGWYHGRVGATADAVVGREAELRVAQSALREASAVVVFRGEAGIGKTTLWEIAAGRACSDGRVLLSARPVESERALALVALSDLLDPVLDEVVGFLPRPQRRALEAALLRSETGSSPPDMRTLAAAVFGSLRLLAADHGVLVAVDDFQWVDAASRSVLEFAFRRLSSVPASAVLAVRAGDANEQLPGFDGRASLFLVDVGPLSLGALQQVVADRLGARFARGLLRRVHEAARGNPFYALEIARAVMTAGPVSAIDELPIPSELDALLRDRIAALPPATRRALAAAAALSEPRPEWIEQEGDLQPAFDAGIVRVERGLVRFGHPLLASSAYALLAPGRRRRLHERLAAVVDDVEQRAWHLAAASAQPDESVALALETAAAQALARGAPAGAGELLELAARHTVDPERAADRRLAAADAYARASDFSAVRRLAEAAVAGLPAGAPRARALVLLSRSRRDDFHAAAALAERAASEAAGDRAAEALAAARLSYVRGFSGELPRALTLVQAALDRADALPAPALVAVLAQAAFMQLAVTGRIDPQLLADARAAEARSGGASDAWEPRYIAALQLMLAERFTEARTQLEQLLRYNEDLGYELRVEDILNVLAELETRAGRPAVGARAAARAAEIRALSGSEQNANALSGYFAAHAAAYLGQVTEARSLTNAGLAASSVSGDTAFGLQHAAVRGFLELSLGNYTAAVEVLEPAAEKLARIAPEMHPLHVPILPNLIEALVALARLDEARVHLSRLDRRGRELGSAGALAAAARARGLLAAAEGETTSALEHLDAALSEHDRS